MSKILKYRALDRYSSHEVFDDSLGSPNYFRILSVPRILTAGKNLIRLQSNSDTMVSNTPIDFEIIDSNGIPLYYEILEVLEYDKSRVISVFVNSETGVGQATLTFLGYAQVNQNNRPITYTEGIPNLKHTFKLFIDSTRHNESEITFRNIPSIGVSEKLVTFVEPSGSNTLTSSVGSVNYIATSQKSLLGSSGFSFIQEMSGSTIRINTPVNPQPSSNFTPSSSIFQSKIKTILRNNLVELDDKYGVTNQVGDKLHYYKSFENSPYELYYNSGSINLETFNRKSYAQLYIDGLSPSTGDVSRIKTYIKSSGQTSSDYKLVSDSKVRNTELLLNYNTNNLENKIGYFTDLSVFTDNYSITSQSGTLPLTASFTNDNLINSIYFNYNNELTNSEYYFVKLNEDKYISFVDNTEYKLSLNMFSSKINNDVELEIYAIGNAFKSTNEYGKLLKRIISTYNSKNYEQVDVIFKSDRGGLGSFAFKINSGQWNISNISLTSNSEFGYTPNHVVMNVQIPTDMRNDKLDFRFEFIDYFGNPSKTGVSSNGNVFVGENTYISHDDNILNGKLFISNVSGSGIILHNPCSKLETGIIESPMFSSFDELVVSESKSIGGFFIFSASGSSFDNCNIPRLTGSDYSNNTGADYVTDDALGFFKFRAHGDDKELTIRETHTFNQIYTQPTITSMNSSTPLEVGSFVTHKSKNDDYLVTIARWYVNSGSVTNESSTYTMTAGVIPSSSNTSYFPIPITEELIFGDGVHTGPNRQLLVAVTHSLETIPNESMCKFTYYINKNAPGGTEDANMSDSSFILCSKAQARKLQLLYPRKDDI